MRKWKQGEIFPVFFPISASEKLSPTISRAVWNASSQVHRRLFFISSKVAVNFFVNQKSSVFNSLVVACLSRFSGLDYILQLEKFVQPTHFS